MHTCENPDTSVTLYYTDNRALLAYDPSLQKQKQSLDRYQKTIPGYRAPDIFYQKKKFRDNPLETNSRLKRDICKSILFTPGTPPINAITITEIPIPIRTL